MVWTVCSVILRCALLRASKDDGPAVADSSFEARYARSQDDGAATMAVLRSRGLVSCPARWTPASTHQQAPSEHRGRPSRVIGLAQRQRRLDHGIDDAA